MSKSLKHIWLVVSTPFKILVKMDHFPNFRGENKKIFELPPPRYASQHGTTSLVPCSCGTGKGMYHLQTITGSACVRQTVVGVNENLTPTAGLEKRTSKVTTNKFLSTDHYRLHHD